MPSISCRQELALPLLSPVSLCTCSAEAFARNAAWAEDEGIVPPGMGAYAQLVQGLLGGAAVAALAAGGWGNDDGWDDRFEDASGLGEEEEEEQSEKEEESEEEGESEVEEESRSGGRG